MSDKTKTPALRFPDSAPWEEKLLGAFGRPFNGLSGKTKTDFGHGEGHYVTYLGIFSNAIVNREHCAPIEIDPSQKAVQKGDVFFTTSSETPDEVGMSAVWLDDVRNTYLNSFCFGFRPNGENDSEFLAYLFRSRDFRKKMAVLAQGISRYNISKGKAMDISLYLPSSPTEQRRIGKFFRELDALIAAREESLGKLESLKKAMLEKMFPQGDAKVPEVRFKGFRGEWMKCGFEQVFQHIPSKHYQIQTDEYLSIGHFPIVDQGKVLIVGFSNNSKKVFKAKDNPVIVFGDHTREIKYIDFDFVVGADGTQLLRSPKQDLPFLNALLIGLPLPNMGYSRHFKFLQEAAFLLPCEIDEQRKIGLFFRSLDVMIAARREEVEKLKQLKKAFLERMFA